MGLILMLHRLTHSLVKQQREAGLLQILLAMFLGSLSPIPLELALVLFLRNSKMRLENYWEKEVLNLERLPEDSGAAAGLTE